MATDGASFRKVTAKCLVPVALLCCNSEPQSIRAQGPKTPSEPAPASPDLLKVFLQGLDQASSADDKTRYIYSLVDLDGDGKPEVIVYLIGQAWCGSGGCPTMVLARTDTSYKIVSYTTITRLPIRVLDRKSNGWRSLAVWVRGGGIQPGYEAELKFDGIKYPLNPSVLPAEPIKEPAPGQIVIKSYDDAKPLYP